MLIYVRIIYGLRKRVYKIENNLIKCLNNCKGMVSCGLAGHRRCIVSNGSHTFHLCVLNPLIISFEFFKDFF